MSLEHIHTHGRRVGWRFAMQYPRRVRHILPLSVTQILSDRRTAVCLKRMLSNRWLGSLISRINPASGIVPQCRMTK